MVISIFAKGIPQDSITVDFGEQIVWLTLIIILVNASYVPSITVPDIIMDNILRLLLSFFPFSGDVAKC